MGYIEKTKLTFEEKIEILRHINEYYSLEEIRDLSEEENDKDLLDTLIEILNISFDSINFKQTTHHFEYLLSCCYRIIELINNDSKLESDHILEKVITIEKKIIFKIKEIDKLHAMWSVFLKRIKEKINSIDIILKNKNNEDLLINNYNDIHYLIFIEKSLMLFKKINNNHPHILNLRDEKNRSFLMNIIKNYAKLFKNAANNGEYDYFEDVVKLICNNKEFKFEDGEYEQYVQEIDKIIQYIRHKEHNKRNLKYIESKLKKIKTIIANKRKIDKRAASPNVKSTQKGQAISQKLSLLHGIRDIFSDDVIKEVAIILKGESLQEYIERIDLTKKVIFTIDDARAQALDDGFSLEKTKKGYILGIHISDVSHYVRENSHIDKEALARTTTLYLPHKAIPMIPNELSTGICSLNPNQNTRAISCFVKLDLHGNIEEYTFCKTLINSSQRVIYNHVGNILTNGCNNAELREALAYLFELSRIEAGKFDMHGIAEQILTTNDFDLPNERLDAVGYQIVAPFMVMANRLAATHFHKAKLPFVYRVSGHTEREHSKKKLLELKRLLESKTLTQEEFENISQTVLEYESYGSYSVDNIGHQSLGYNAYSHWTSPIRRYPDLLNQRMMDTFLFQQMGKRVSKAEQELLKEQWDSKLRILVAHINRRQKQINECRQKVKTIDK